jgi:eukaryotic-like serine/threonine-protein kinase
MLGGRGSGRNGGTGMRVETAPPDVPGLLLERLLRFGAYGEVWRALELDRVGAVAVLVGAPSGDADAVARESALLRRLDHENVVQFRSVIDLRDGRRAVVTDLAPGGDLETLVKARGALPQGEVVTLTVAVARALEHVHALGFVHGRLSPHEVLFASDGRPVVSGVGLPILLGVGSGGSRPPTYPGPADDVLALGEIVRFALTGGTTSNVKGPLAAVVAACTAPDAEARPSPARVASLAWEAGSPEPIRSPPPPVVEGDVDQPDADQPDADRPDVDLPNADQPDAGEPSGRFPIGFRALAFVGGVAVVAGVTAAAVLLAVRGDAAPPRPVGQRVPLASASAAPVSSDPGTLTDPRALVAALASSRARAFSAASESALPTVDAPGSPALAGDIAFVQELRRRGLSLRGLAFDVSDARVLEVGEADAIVQARVSTSAHVQARADGSIAQQVPTSVRTVRLTLVRTASGWRIAADT